MAAATKTPHNQLDMPQPLATPTPLQCTVIAVHHDAMHRFSKPTVPHITLAEGLGVQGDAHCGTLVQHRSRVRAHPQQPNLRQVHVISAALLAHLHHQGFTVAPGALGENITVSAAPYMDWHDWIALPCSTLLDWGANGPCLELTGLRNPCHQIDTFQKGLISALLDRGEQQQLLRKAGVMAVVRRGGMVRAGDSITLRLPPPPHLPMERV